MIASRQRGESMTTTLGSAAFSMLGMFVVTNIDDFLLLLLLFSAPGRDRDVRYVVAGQFLAFVCVLAGSWAAALAAMALPPRILGLVGLVPIGLGIAALLEKEGPGASAAKKAGPHRTVLGVAGLTLSLATENFAVCTAYFATLGPKLSLLVAGIYLVLLGLLCRLALRTARIRAVRRAIERTMLPIAPYLYIMLGLFLLSQSRWVDHHR
jgi:cadmium resistance protein CadD (predicted permease)